MEAYRQIFDLNKDWQQNEIVVQVFSDGTAWFRHHDTHWTLPEPIAHCLQRARTALTISHPKASRIVVLLDDDAKWDETHGTLVV